MTKYDRTSFFLLAALTFAAFPTFAQTNSALGAQNDFRFRFVGPQIGNRVAAVAGVPGDPTTYYAGAASGGVWKSVDGGNRFAAIFDEEPVTAIGALAVAPSEPSTVWAGTGEAWAIRDSDVAGNGVYKSVDAGKTWKHMGLDATGRIGRIIVNPTNPENVFVCALGRATGPQPERGVFRTNDGGAHWDRVLFADENTGCSGLAMDAHNPHTLLAGMWQVEMHTYGEFSGGPGSAVYVSHDNGEHWTKLSGHGLPKSPLGKIDVAIAPSNPNRVYALIQTANQGSLWRSDDGGDTWRAGSHSRELIGRAGYYIRLAVSPSNENEVLVANSSFHQSLDGGDTFRAVPWGGDTHDIWIDPTNADRLVVTDDAGMNITTVHGRGFHRVQLPIGQMYHVAVDDRIPYWIYSNMQDDGTMRGVSTARGYFRGYGDGNPEGAEAPPRVRPAVGGTAGSDGENWEHHLGGCESGFTLPDPTDTDVVWASCYGDEVTRYNAKTKEARSVSPWLHTLDSPPNEAKYRCHWTPPLAIDPFDHNTVYYGCQVIFKTSDAGQSWSVISPDLSTHDPSRLGSSGGIVGDNLGQFYGEVVFSIAPSPIKKGLIWAGTNDGKVWYTTDGKQWNDVTGNVTGLPAWGTVSKIEPSHFDAGTAYIAVDAHLMDNRDPFIFKTSDYGKTWKKITGGLPDGTLAYTKSIAEDPNHRGVLFAGTGNAFYYSLNDGQNWNALQTGLPHAPVSWIVVQPRFHDVVVSTYGRGLFILDDITPLEQLADHPAETNATLFKSSPAYRLFPGGKADIDFSLPSATAVDITITDSRGDVVREYKKIPAHAGLNRRTWDLRYTPPRLVKLRTDAPDNPFIWEETRFRRADSRPITHWGIQQAEAGPVATPGTYKVRLTPSAGGKSEGFAEQTGSIQLLKSPETTAPDADLEASLQIQLRIRNDINATSDMVNQIEWMRKQATDVEKMLRADNTKPNLLDSVQTVEHQMEEVEFKLISRVEANSDDKYFSMPYKIYLNLIWLNAQVGTGGGDVAGGVSYRPTDTSVMLLNMLEKDLAAARADYQNLMTKQVPAFNKSITAGGLLPLSTPMAVR